MLQPIPIAAASVVGYLLGAIPFGYVVAKWHGVDIFKEGSCNPGATNVKRVCGKNAGNLVFALDFLKGAVATFWVIAFTVDPESAEGDLLGLIGLTAAILGHSFSVFTGFRGGKGVATMLGGAVALMPVAALFGTLVWIVLFYSTRFVSVASIGLALTLPVATYLREGPRAPLFVFATMLAVFVIYRHRENIVRLARGTENRFSPHPSTGPESDTKSTKEPK